MNLFVYGTLLKGMNRYPVLSGSQFLGMGFTTGHLYNLLFDVGDYPAIGSGNGTVHGELYDIDGKKLKDLDRIEGYDPKDARHSLYVRKNITCISLNDGSRIEATTYFYNHPLKKHMRIVCGDYRRYQLENLSETQWYIAYGADTSLNHLTGKVGGIHERKTGYIEGYQLIFNKNGDEGHACPNIMYKGFGYRCPFVAYRITKAQLFQLDRYEGEPAHYIRVGLPFLDTKGTADIGHVYIANPGKLIQNHRPSPTYLRYIIDGYGEHGFETSFLSKF